MPRSRRGSRAARRGTPATPARPRAGRGCALSSGDEARAGNQRGEAAAFVERHARVAARMERPASARAGSAAGSVTSIVVERARACAPRLPGVAVDPLELVPPAVLLGGALGDELVGEDLAEGVVVAPPADADEVDERLGLEALEVARARAAARRARRRRRGRARDTRSGWRLRVGASRPRRPATCRSAGSARGRAGRPRPRGRRPRRRARGRRGCGRRGRSRAGRSGCRCGAARQLAQPGPPDGALEVVLDVAQPVRRAHQRRPAADRRDRDARAVGSGAEADVLPGGHGRLWCGHGAKLCTIRAAASAPATCPRLQKRRRRPKRAMSKSPSSRERPAACPPNRRHDRRRAQRRRPPPSVARCAG